MHPEADDALIRKQLTELLLYADEDLQQAALRLVALLSSGAMTRAELEAIANHMAAARLEGGPLPRLSTYLPKLH